MADIVNIQEPKSIVGPQRRGNSVIVEGRVIPKLHCHDQGDNVEIVLDGRFSLTVPEALSYQVAWMLAHAIAIGAGYSHLRAETKEHPFAPQAVRLDAVPQK